MEKLPSLSVVIPCFNEAENIEPLLSEALRALPGIAEEFEIVVVNDGSTDNTLEKARKVTQVEPRVRVIDKENGGYGSAVKAGLSAGCREWFFLTDGDLQFKFEELQQFVPFACDFDFIIGYRKRRADPFIRTVNANLLRLWSAVLLELPLSIYDINCAFKLMRGESVRRCLPLISEGAMVTTELLLRARRNKVRIKQLPVTHLPRKCGAQSGANPTVILKAMRETLILRRKLEEKLI